MSNSQSLDSSELLEINNRLTELKECRETSQFKIVIIAKQLELNKNYELQIRLDSTKINQLRNDYATCQKAKEKGLDELNKSERKKKTWSKVAKWSIFGNAVLIALLIL